MSATVPILHAIKTHLTERLPDWDIALLPNNPSGYYLSHEKGAVLIGYASSHFGQPRSTDVITQTRTLSIMLTVLARDLHSDEGAVELLDRLRLLVVGFRPPDCTPCWLVDEFFDGEGDEPTGIWQYQLVVQTDTVQVQQTEEKSLVKLVEVIAREKGRGYTR